MDSAAASLGPASDARSALPVRWMLWVSVIAGALAFETGIVLTSARLWAAIDSAQVPLSRSFWLTHGHLYGAAIAAVAALAAFILSLRDSRRDITGILASVLIIGSAGAFFAPSVTGAAAPDIVAALHAVSGQLVFAGLCIAAVLASTDFQSSQRLSLEGGFPLRGVALWLPLVLLSQVLMGALYRHNVWGIMPHMGGAMATAFLLVGEAVVLLQRAPDHPLLRAFAQAALWLILLQVLLGISDFLVRLLDFQDSTVWFGLSIAHASNGCFTFALGTCFAYVVRKVLIPGSPQEDRVPLTS